MSMSRETLTPVETAALKRVKGGYVIPADMRKHLTRRGLLDQLLGGDRVSEKGLQALGQTL